MSILTKILIILLTLSSLFLCGYVVQYVATANNYKQESENLQRKANNLQQQLDDRTNELKDETADKKRIEDVKQQEINNLQSQIKNFDEQLSQLKLQKSELDARVLQWETKTALLTEETAKYRKDVNDYVKKYQDTESQLLVAKQQLKELEYELAKKDALLDTLRADAKRMLEENVSLKNKLDKLLRPTGRKIVSEEPVTMPKDTARAVSGAATATIGLKGKITGLDLQNSIAQISLGSVDGVKKGMKFHVSRDSVFVCDIVIIDAVTDKAVGLLELIQQEPKIGDTVSTNL